MQKLLQHYLQILFTAKQFHTLCVLIPNFSITIFSPRQAQQCLKKESTPTDRTSKRITTCPISLLLHCVFKCESLSEHVCVCVRANVLACLSLWDL